MTKGKGYPLLRKWIEKNISLDNYFDVHQLAEDIVDELNPPKAPSKVEEWRNRIEGWVKDEFSERIAYNYKDVTRIRDFNKFAEKLEKYEVRTSPKGNVYFLDSHHKVRGMYRHR